MNKLNKSFYLNDDVVQISKELIGKFLFTNIKGDEVTGGMIVETEAYNGAPDKACHAYNNKRTARTEIMFSEGGVAYVYLCYGMHALFNVITGAANIPKAVLIRAIEPTHGIETMLKRRKKDKLNYSLTAGPGKLTQALGITVHHYGCDLSGDNVWVEDRQNLINENELISSPRVGVHYAEEYALSPWRFRLAASKWTSKAK